MRRRRLHVITALSVMVVVLGGCTAHADSQPSTVAAVPSTEVRVGLIDYSFERSAQTLAATRVTLTVTNAGGTEHDLQVLDGQEVLGSTRMLDPGEKQTITVDLDGLDLVTFLCTVPGHESMGMVEDVEVAPVTGEATSSPSATPREESTP